MKPVTIKWMYEWRYIHIHSVESTRKIWNLKCKRGTQKAKKDPGEAGEMVQ